MGDKILIVEDLDVNRILFKRILEDSYEVMLAEDGQRAIDILSEHWKSLDVVLLDLYMPKVNGFEVLHHMKENGWLKHLPVLVISGEESVEVENKCFDLGASDFVHKPFDVTLVKNRIKNIVELSQYKNQLEEKVESQTVTLRKQYELLQKQTVTLRKQYQMLQEQTAKFQAYNEKTIETLGTIIEYRDLDSGEHVRRIKAFTNILAKQVMKMYPEYNLTETKIQEIVTASALHDMGKISIPDSILLKPGRLTAEELEFMKSHTTRGCEMLDHIDGIWDERYRTVCYEICCYHHERYDGKGYPDGLKGEEIPISAQIVSVTDTYEALVNERVYKNAYSCDEAFHMIINGECGVFSPKIMECLRQVKAQFEEVANRLK